MNPPGSLTQSESEMEAMPVLAAETESPVHQIVRPTPIKPMQAFLPIAGAPFQDNYSNLLLQTILLSPHLFPSIQSSIQSQLLSQLTMQPSPLPGFPLPSEASEQTPTVPSLLDPLVVQPTAQIAAPISSPSQLLPGSSEQEMMPRRMQSCKTCERHGITGVIHRNGFCELHDCPCASCIENKRKKLAREERFCLKCKNHNISTSCNNDHYKKCEFAKCDCNRCEIIERKREKDRSRVKQYKQEKQLKKKLDEASDKWPK